MSSQAVGNASRTSIKVNNYTAHEKHIQQILAVTFASTSVILALVAFYCFARMKKNLRHQYVKCFYSPADSSRPEQLMFD